MCKIFVGNVPFQCNEIEFVKCFESLPGFIKAEIVYKQNTNISRGFGFVTFDNKNNAMNLINENIQIKCKNRILRFSKYESLENNVHQKKNHYDNSKMQFKFDKNIVMIKNKSENIVMTRDYLYEIFKNFGTIAKYFVMTDQDTGTSKKYGIIEFDNKNDYYNILKKKEIITNDGNIFEITKWKNKFIQIPKEENDKKISYKKNIFL